MASSVELLTAYVTLSIDGSKIGPDVRRQFGSIEATAERTGKDAGKRFASSFAPSLKRMGAMIAGAFAVSGATDFVKDAVGEAREAQKVGALTESIIKSTGGAAKVTADQIGDLAGAISLKTGMDDEAIQAGANMLLTFKNVRNEVGKGANVFDRATQAATDLSAAGFGDMAGQSKMLGKALNDPIKGISALGRSGVTFTEQQKAQIKALVLSGDTLKAQKIILGEVESQVGGAAEASATAGEKASVAFGNLKEQIGTALLPVVDKVANVFTTKVVPAISTFITGLQEGTGAGGAFVDTVSSIVGTGKAAVEFVREHDTAAKILVGTITALVVVTKAHSAVLAVQAAGGMAQWLAQTKIITALTKTWTAVNWLLNASILANPIVLIAVGIAAFAAALVIAYKKSETFRNIVDGAFRGVKKVVTAAVDFVVGFVKDNWKLLPLLLLGPIGIAVIGIIKHWDKIKAGAKAAWDGAKGIFLGMVGWVGRLPGRILTKLGDLGGLLKDAGIAVIQGFWNGLKEKWEDVKDWFGEITASIPIEKGPPAKDAVLLTPAGRLVMQGFLRGLQFGEAQVTHYLNAMTGRLAPTVQSQLRKGISAALAGGTEGLDKYLDSVTKNIDRGLDRRLKDIEKNLEQSLGRIQAQRENREIGKRTAKLASEAAERMAVAAEKAAATQAKALTKMVRQTARELRKVAREYDAATAKLKEMQDVRAGVASSISGELDLGSLITPDETNQYGYTKPGGVTFESVAGAVAGLASRALAFARKLGALRKAGIPVGLIQEVAGLGTVQGIKVADALLSGSAGEIKQLASDYAAISTNANAVGDVIVEALYGKSIAAQEQLIAGLLRRPAIRKAARTFASAFSEELLAALGVTAQPAKPKSKKPKATTPKDGGSAARSISSNAAGRSAPAPLRTSETTGKRNKDDEEERLLKMLREINLDITVGASNRTKANWYKVGKKTAEAQR